MSVVSHRVSVILYGRWSFLLMRKLFLILAATAFLQGCGANEWAPSATGESASVTQGRTVSAELADYYHTNKTLGDFYVNGQLGCNIAPGSGGGSFVCCVELPNPWREGYFVTVAWEDHDGRAQKRDVLVPKYDPKTLSDFNVHFLRDGEIKVFAVRMMLGHPDYPLKSAESKMPVSVFGRRVGANL
jgi:hypothetical protein